MRVVIWSAVSSKIQAHEDKVSLEDQQRMAREICERNNWEVVDTLTVPGFSRDYYTLDDVASAAEDKEVYAFRRLQEHIKRKDFQIFMYYDADRFGRKASLVHEVIGRITGSVRAQLYSLVDGPINHESADIYALVKGLQAESSVKKFVAQRKKGIAKRASLGLNISSVNPRFHSVVRDPTNGKVIAITLNEALNALWDDVFDLVVNQLEPYDTLEERLYERGHTGENGRQLPRRAIYYLLNNPAFWGHRALNYAASIHHSTEGYRRWVWDETSEAPDGVTIYRNVLPSVYTGENAARMRAEMLRRVVVVKGKATTKSVKRFSQLVYCDECGRRMVYSRSINKQKRVFHYMRCNTRYHKYQPGQCSQNKHVPFSNIQEAVTLFIEARLQGDDIHVGKVNTSTNTIQNLEKDIARLEGQMNTLLNELSLAPDAARDYYRSKIADISQQLKERKERLSKLEKAEYLEKLQATRQTYSLNRLREITIEKLWDMPDPQINALLIEILGDYRFAASDGEITHITNEWRRKR
jgi:hypothetical protein